MAFKPKQQNQSNTNTNSKAQALEQRNYPTPEGGSQEARLSLIVDLGVQEREPFEDPKTGEMRPQKPAQQIALFADLVEDIVDYGGEIGSQPYRLMLNKSFRGDITGINFAPVPPRDAEGKLVEGKQWTYHPASPLTKLAKVVGADAILDGSDLDIEQLLDKPFMATVNVKVTESDKKDDKGNPIVYTNVNFGGFAAVPKKLLGSVAALQTPPMVITFDDVTEEQAKYIRADVRRKIRLATNYPGSQMQRVLEGGDTDQAEPAVSGSKRVVSKEAPPARQDDADSFDDDVPF